MRLSRRTFSQASAAGSGLWLTGCATTQPQVSLPPTSAMQLRKARPAARPARRLGGDLLPRAARSGARSRCSCTTAARCACAQNSKTNHGYCCPRGHLIAQQLYNPDRIKTPLKRTNAVKGRGVDPRWVPNGWNEALDTVAGKMLELRKNGEAHKFVDIRGRCSSTSTDLLCWAMPRIYGTTNDFSHSAICAEAEKMGPGLTQG